MKQQSGFMLLEVMLAVFIFAMTSTSIIQIQFRVLRRAVDDRELTIHLFRLKKELYNMLLHPDTKLYKKKIELENPTLKIEKEERTIHPKSSLAPFANQLTAVTVEASWLLGAEKRSTRMAGLVYQKKEEKKNA